MENLPCGKNQAYLITDRLMRKYLCGADVDEGLLLVTDKLFYFTDARYFSAAKVELEKVGVNANLYSGLESVKSFIEKNDIQELLVDFDSTTVSEYNSYLDLGVKVKDCSIILKRVRAVKNGNQLKSIAKACKIAEKAYHTAIKDIKKGITERWLKERLESLMISFGAEETSFETIVAFGKNAAVPHHKTCDCVLEDNSVVLIDMGCKVNGYCSDITRTAFFGKPDKKFIDCYSAVLKANVTAEEKITEGDLTCVADGYARNVLKEVGLDKYFTHSLGHGVGLQIHEYPTLSTRVSEQLKEGMVFTIEPGVYIDGEFGIRIEDTVVMKNGRVERLFADSKELIIL